jgi:hypothetical protein
LLGKTHIWPEKLIQEWCWIVHHFIEFSFRILFWGHISSLNETCLMARKADPRMVLNCLSFYCGVVIPHFVLGSHLTLQQNMSFRCLFVVMKSWDASFKGYFDKICLIKLQHAIKINQSWRLKVFWLQK